MRIYVTDDNIHDVVEQEIRRLGNTANLNHIDVRDVMNFSHLFQSSDFNGDISEWDVSRMVNSNFMFKLSKFSGDISKWSPKLQAAIGMFDNAVFFGNISRFDMSTLRVCKHATYSEELLVDVVDRQQQLVVIPHIKSFIDFGFSWKLYKEVL